MAFLQPHSAQAKTWQVRFLLLALIICLTMLTSGCSRVVPLQIRNHHNFPVEVYDAAFVDPAPPVLLGNVPPNGTLDSTVERLSKGESYHIRICKVGGALLQDITTPTDEVNASFDNNRHNKWKIDVKP